MIDLSRPQLPSLPDSAYPVAYIAPFRTPEQNDPHGVLAHIFPNSNTQTATTVLIQLEDPLKTQGIWNNPDVQRPLSRIFRKHAVKNLLWITGGQLQLLNVERIFRSG